MALYTGSLNTFGLAPFSGRFPVIEMIPSNSATAGKYIFARDPVKATFITDDAFTVELASVFVTPLGTHYTMQVQWLNSDGKPVGKDWPPFKFYPDGNPGELMSTVDRPLMGTEWWVTDEPGVPPSATAGDMYVDPITLTYGQIKEL